MGLLEIKARRTVNDLTAFHWEASVGAQDMDSQLQGHSQTHLFWAEVLEGSSGRDVSRGTRLLYSSGARVGHT